MSYSTADLEAMLVEKINKVILSSKEGVGEKIVDLLKRDYLLVRKVINETEATRLRTSELICGVGVVDIEVGDESRLAYEAWRGMLRRSYSSEYKIRKKAYEECTSSEEWKVFSNFLKFYNEHYRDGYHLDKDILVEGNKLYSKETCCFVPPALNGILVNSESSGVSFDSRKNKFRASISIKGKSKNLGYGNTREEAERKYRDAKRKYIEGAVDEFRSRGDIEDRVANALLRRAKKLLD